MRNPVAHHSIALEFGIVITFAFGYFAYISILTVIAVMQSASLEPIVVSTGATSEGLYWLIKYELVVFLMIATYLWLRGWKYRHFRVEATVNSTLIGCGLYLAAMFCYYTTYLIFYPLVLPFYGDALDEVFSVTASLPSIISLSVINPIFEEVFVLGYVVKALEGRTTLATALSVTVGVRLIYHLYQGPLGVASIVPIGFIFGWFYIKYGKLWSVIVAHALMDFIGLTSSSGA